MYTSDLTTLSRSASSKGFQKDRQNHEAIKRREQKWRDIDDINKFAEIMADLIPDIYGGKDG